MKEYKQSQRKKRNIVLLEDVLGIIERRKAELVKKKAELEEAIKKENELKQEKIDLKQQLNDYQLVLEKVGDKYKVIQVFDIKLYIERN